MSREIDWILSQEDSPKTWDEIAEDFNRKFETVKTGNAVRKIFHKNRDKIAPEELDLIEGSKPKVLIYDIETAPLLAYVWSMFQQGFGLNAIHKDWYIISWSAKWLGAPASETMYMDQRDAKNMEDDSLLLKGIWKLLDEADIVITQNGKRFDNKKLNARFVLNDMLPPSTYRDIDTLEIAKKRFGFTSRKLAYMTDKLCTDSKKLSHANFPGFELWKECLSGNLEAWKEMEDYNKNDVLSLEELYHKLIPWDSTIDFNVYHDSLEHQCSCGSTDLKKNGFHYTNMSKFQRFRCLACGKESRDSTNLLSKEKRKTLKRRTLR